MKQYTSFLVCFHEKQTNIYISGVPLATIHNGTVELYKVNPLLLPESQFKTVEELSNALSDVINHLRAAIPDSVQEES
jgi:hypothetical protein